MKNKVVLIQGALDIEIEYLVNQLINKTKKVISEYEFYEGIINDVNVVISKTLVGTINSTIATTLGITFFKPDIVINQGIAGAYKKDLHIGDIIIGNKCCNINAYKTPPKFKEEGANPFEWEPNKRAKDIKLADPKLTVLFEKLFVSNTHKKIYNGVLGSGDIFNREVDRILWINNIFNNDCEDMESIGVYSVCNNFKIPCIGIRIISNNEILLEKIDKSVAIQLQQLLAKSLNSLIKDYFS